MLGAHVVDDPLAYGDPLLYPPSLGTHPSHSRRHLCRLCARVEEAIDTPTRLVVLVGLTLIEFESRMHRRVRQDIFGRAGRLLLWHTDHLEPGGAYVTSR